MFESLNWGAISVVVAVIGNAIGLVTWAVRAEGRSNTNTVKADQALAEVATVRHLLSEHKEKVARDYVTFAHMKDMEDRIMKQFDRLFEAVRSGH